MLRLGSHGSLIFCRKHGFRQGLHNFWFG
ncbi:hypothetical protein AERO8C_170132 [Aeromonas veronii]|uniref:Uncharacterized protein n=1 Tax=Aeromonas veronii TaxID=654 RepID=A0A653KZP9_AERVE|nr:hypothetical protein AERO8C_170132 [Aeromonas veronii]